MFDASSIRRSSRHNDGLTAGCGQRGVDETDTLSGGTRQAPALGGGARSRSTCLARCGVSTRPLHPLPASRKVRALLAYVALASKPVARGPLCELLWDVPNDPRGELRWCLSKIRGLLDDGASRRVLTRGTPFNWICRGVGSTRLTRSGPPTPGSRHCRSSNSRRSRRHSKVNPRKSGDRQQPVFTVWLTARRRRLRNCRSAALEQLVMRGPDDQALIYLDRPARAGAVRSEAHECLFKALARQGKTREADAHRRRPSTASNVKVSKDVIRAAWHAARTVMGTAIRANEGPRHAGRGAPPLRSRRSSTDHRPASPGGAADALAHDVTTRRPSCAACSSWRRARPRLHGEASAQRSGYVRMSMMSSAAHIGPGRRLTVTVELAETCTARTVWPILRPHTDDAFVVLDEIGNRIVALIASEIEALERDLAILKPTPALWMCVGGIRFGPAGTWDVYMRGRGPVCAILLRNGAGACILMPLRAKGGLLFNASSRDAFQRWND